MYLIVFDIDAWKKNREEKPNCTIEAQVRSSLLLSRKTMVLRAATAARCVRGAEMKMKTISTSKHVATCRRRYAQRMIMGTYDRLLIIIIIIILARDSQGRC